MSCLVTVTCMKALSAMQEILISFFEVMPDPVVGGLNGVVVDWPDQKVGPGF